MILKNEIYTVTAVDNGFSGEGIAKIDNLTVFVPFLIKGETAEIKILKVLKTHAFADIVKIIKPSPDRCEPLCPAFGKCGGCNFLNINYEQQLHIKKNQVEECLKKYCRMPVTVNDVVGTDNPYHYRNKAQYPFQGISYGFYAPRSHTLIPISDCLMQNEQDAEILKVVSSYLKKTNAKIRHVYTRYGDNCCMVVLVTKSSKLPFTNVLVSELIRAVPNIKSIIINVNPDETNVILGKKNKVLYGSGKIDAKIGEVKFSVSPLSFFQVNSRQTKVLYDIAGKLLGKNTNHLADLYCGIGSIGLYLADKVKKITGVEIVPDAIEDAKINAKINNITNARYICGASEKVLPELIKQDEKPDVVILDPPRKGCDKSLLDCLLTTNIDKIIYISCSPSTLARDLDILSQNYNISPITPVDMFPNTLHVECCVLLCRND